MRQKTTIEAVDHRIIDKQQESPWSQIVSPIDECKQFVTGKIFYLWMQRCW